MKINLDLSAKQILSGLLVAGNLFAILTSANYVFWRYKANTTFGIMEFDLNSRMPEIKAKYDAIIKANQDKAEKDAAAANAAAAAATAAANATTTTTLPKK